MVPWRLWARCAHGVMEKVKEQALAEKLKIAFSSKILSYNG